MKKISFTLLLVALVFGVFTCSASAASITVQKGDSLWKIAQRYNVSFAEVIKMNDHFDDKHLIYPGDVVYIPDGSTGTNQDQGNSSALSGSDTAKINEVVNLVNAERKKQGLQPLTLNTKLTEIATEKARDMSVNNYFSHNSPTYGTPFQMLKKYGVSYKTAGENIAAGQKTPSEVMQSWMNSSGHRANILNSNYTEIGVGYYSGGSYGRYWVQIFTGQ